MYYYIHVILFNRLNWNFFEACVYTVCPRWFDIIMEPHMYSIWWTQGISWNLFSHYLLVDDIIYVRSLTEDHDRTRIGESCVQYKYLIVYNANTRFFSCWFEVPVYITLQSTQLQFFILRFRRIEHILTRKMSIRFASALLIPD